MICRCIRLHIQFFMTSRSRGEAAAAEAPSPGPEAPSSAPEAPSAAPEAPSDGNLKLHIRIPVKLYPRGEYGPEAPSSASEAPSEVHKVAY